MKRILALFAAISVSLISVSASAITVGSVGDNPFSVPSDGGTGSFTCDTGTCTVNKEFTALGDIPIVITPANVPSSGTDTLHFEESITNNTGIDWTDFHLGFIPIDNNPGLTLSFENVINATNQFTSFSAGTNELSMFGSVPNGDVFSLAYDLVMTSSPGSFDLFAVSELPTVTTVPEPTTLALLALGFAGLVTARRHRAI